MYALKTLINTLLLRILFAMKGFLSKMAGAFFVLFLSPAFMGNAVSGDKSGLKDIVKPYAGVYECEEFLIGGIDKTESFAYFRVELTLDGKLKLASKDKNGHKRKTEAAYEQDRSNGKFYIIDKNHLGNRKFEFEFRGGELCVYAKIDGKMLVTKWKRI